MNFEIRQEMLRRRRVVKGFAFKNYSDVVKESIYTYLETGEMDILFPEAYRALDGLMQLDGTVAPKKGGRD